MGRYDVQQCTFSGRNSAATATDVGKDEDGHADPALRRQVSGDDDDNDDHGNDDCIARGD